MRPNVESALSQGELTVKTQREIGNGKVRPIMWIVVSVWSHQCNQIKVEYLKDEFYTQNLIKQTSSNIMLIMDKIANVSGTGLPISYWLREWEY